MLIIVALIIISIFFPPAWFALAVYIVYLIKTRKKRRDRVMMYEINRLIATGQHEVTLKYLYYEAAKSFAADHGASMSPFKNDPDDDCLFFDMVIRGKEYKVSIQRWMKNETILRVSNISEEIDTLNQLLISLKSKLINSRELRKDLLDNIALMQNGSFDLPELPRLLSVYFNQILRSKNFSTSALLDHRAKQIMQSFISSVNALLIDDLTGKNSKVNLKSEQFPDFDDDIPF